MRRTQIWKAGAFGVLLSALYIIHAASLARYIRRSYLLRARYDFHLPSVAISADRTNGRFGTPPDSRAYFRVALRMCLVVETLVARCPYFFKHDPYN